MSLVDIIVLLAVILVVFAIIFFNYIFPKIKGEKSACASCPTVKRAKRLVKDYKKSKKE